MKKAFAMLATCAAMALAAPAAHAETTLRVSNWLPPTHMIVTDIIEPWAKKVEEETDGRVKVEILSALGKPQAHFDLVRKGVADVAMGVDGYTADRFVLPYAVKLPFLADDATSASVAYWRTHQKHFAAKNEFEGVKLLTLWVHGPGNLHTTGRDMASMDDLDGLKARVSGGIVQDIADKLGVVPQFSPASQAYELLSKGVVDGVFFNLDSLPAFKIDGILKKGLIVPGGFYRDSHFMIMNQAKYDGLSKEDQAAIDRVSGETLALIAGQAWDRADAKAMEQLNAQGYQFVTPSPEFLAQLKERLTPLRTAWVEKVGGMGLDGEKILADYAAEIEKVAAEQKAKTQ